MKIILTLVVLVLALSLSLVPVASAALPLCSCPLCEGSPETRCKTSNGTKIDCATYLLFAACPIFP
jgi:hypothetical protein